VAGPDLAGGERDCPATDVRVAADLVGMGMVAVVLGDPPAVAEPDQKVAVNPADQAVCTFGAGDLAMPGVVPDEAGLEFTLATAIPPRDGRSPELPWSVPGALIVGFPDPSEAEDPVRRRTFTRLAGASLVGAVLADDIIAAGHLHGAEAFVTALVAPASAPATTQPADLPALAKAVASAKRTYQSCRYTEVMSQLPALLLGVQGACDNLDRDARLRACALSADAYHVAASVLLKMDDYGLAWLAAERSMRAAALSQEPLAVGTSARIVTHALMADGHLGAATTVAGTYAQRLAAEVRNPTPESLSVYGSLLLRGALAAAQAEDRDGSTTLLDEAGQAGSRLGSDDNHRWTAFGPVNVLLHRINVAVRLGDAGSAINYAPSKPQRLARAMTGRQAAPRHETGFMRWMGA
jgi:hypothetical protein